MEKLVLVSCFVVLFVLRKEILETRWSDLTVVPLEKRDLRLKAASPAVFNP